MVDNMDEFLAAWLKPWVPTLMSDKGLFLPPGARGWYDHDGQWHAGIPITD